MWSKGFVKFQGLVLEGPEQGLRFDLDKAEKLKEALILVVGRSLCVWKQIVEFLATLQALHLYFEMADVSALPPLPPKHAHTDSYKALK